MVPQPAERQVGLQEPICRRQVQIEAELRQHFLLALQQLLRRGAAQCPGSMCHGLCVLAGVFLLVILLALLHEDVGDLQACGEDYLESGRVRLVIQEREVLLRYGSGEVQRVARQVEGASHAHEEIHDLGALAGVEDRIELSRLHLHDRSSRRVPLDAALALRLHGPQDTPNHGGREHTGVSRGSADCCRPGAVGRDRRLLRSSGIRAAGRRGWPLHLRGIARVPSAQPRRRQRLHRGSPGAEEWR
mmetsp:Transcript_932/g.2293  ORF Transcript_932/g.2293 Transcript_932/m.2293 type:complete len:246 (-) Transcript_932:1427-2164(-)